MPEIINLLVDTENIRIDKYISLHTDKLSRQKIIELIKAQKIMLNDFPVEPSRKVKAGDRIKIEIPDQESINLIPQDIPFEILYEDEDILVINKPPHLVVHPACGHSEGTLVNALLYRVGSLSTAGGNLKPGIVHRLDKGTSGIMIIAKNDNIHSKLGNMFERHTVKKFYRLLVFSIPRPLAGTIETLYGRDQKNRKKFTTKVREGKKAITIYNTIEQFGDIASLVEAQIITGRTHQIRVHFSEILNCPIIGEDVYSRNRRIRRLDDQGLRDVLAEVDRPLLHSYKIEFTHPLKQKWLSIKCEPPSDFLNVLEILRSKYGRK